MTKMIETEALGYKEYKCLKCGWLHAALPISAIPEITEMYLRCFRCRAPSFSFVPAGRDDAPDGCTLQPVYVPGVWPE
jgi:DNA-directed RNA polymerase subunit RPC12/RpoP